MATVTLRELAALRSPLRQLPHRLGGGTGWLRPVGAKASLAAVQQEAPAAPTWSHQPLRSLRPVEGMRA